MRRILATAIATGLTLLAHPLLACDTRVDLPVVVEPDQGSALGEASRLEVLASADISAAQAADREATRLVASASQLRADARLDAGASPELLRAAATLEMRAVSSRARARELRARGLEERARAAELRAGVRRVTAQITMPVVTPLPMHHRRMRPL